MLINVLDPRVLAAILLMLSAGALYFACRMAMRAVIWPDASSPGRRALCLWLPVAGTSVAAILTHHPGVAIATIFGTSVAYLSLVLGITTYTGPLHSDRGRPRVWAFVLAPVLVALLAGLGGVLNALHAAMLLVLGGAILAVWREDVAMGTVSSSGGANQASGHSLNGMLWAQLFFAIGLAGVAGTAAVRAAAFAALQTPLPSEILVALSVLSPMLILPALRTCVTVAERGDVQGAVSAIVGTVLLNLCALLPIIILLWYHVSGVSLHPLAFFSLAAVEPSGPMQGLVYPNGIWRLETIVLLVLGFGLIPVALGRMALGRIESTILALGYVLYLAAVAFSARGG
jgi:Ca2+/Na+ antiporter